MQALFSNFFNFLSAAVLIFRRRDSDQLLKLGAEIGCVGISYQMCIRDRIQILKIYYGEEYGMHAEVAEDGTTVTLRLPFWKEVEHE